MPHNFLPYGSLESDGKPRSQLRSPAASGHAVRNSGGEWDPTPARLEELERQAAQAEVVHNDHTSMRVLSLDRDTDISPERNGVFTSRLVWIVQERQIAPYFTGCNHAGEDLAEVLKLACRPS